MYDGTYNNAWLDIGFCKENGEWRALRDYEVQDTWFCDANLDDYEEVVVFAPYFGEYRAYVTNYDGVLVTVPPNTEDFQPDLAEFEKRITPKQRQSL